MKKTENHFEVVDKYDELVSAYKLAPQVADVKKYRNPVRHERFIKNIFSNEEIQRTQQDELSLQPKGIKTKLKKHQLIGLKWMVDKENYEDTPLFWTKIPDDFCKSSGCQDIYMNKISRMHSTGKPKTVSGGLFCDDMGLGKTLTMIALIMENDKDRKNLTTLGELGELNSEDKARLEGDWGIENFSDSDNELNKTMDSMHFGNNSSDSQGGST